MFFPTVSGTNLLRQKITFPQDLAGDLNLVFVPFQQWQQMEVDSWIPFVQKLEEIHPSLCSYELPTIYKMNLVSQMFINEGMRAGIPNPRTRERTVTLYLDKPRFRQQLDMPDEDHIYIFLLDPQGRVLWRERGAYDPEKTRALLEIVT